MKIIFLNGPPGTGKTTATLALTKAFEDVRLYAMKQPMVSALKSIYGLTDEQWNDADAPLVKDAPSKHFMGISPRRAQINLAELYFKPTHGPDVFGRLAVREIRNSTMKFCVVDGVGFRPECEPVVKHFHGSQCCLIQLYRDGCDYLNDSRSYIDMSDLGVTTIEIRNRFEKEMFMDYVVYQVNKWLEPQS